MTDKVEKLNGALLQHGPENDRIYLMKVGTANPSGLVQTLLAKARQEGYSKIFAKVPVSQVTPFIEAGFLREAQIPGFFSGTIEAIFLGYYLNDERAFEPQANRLDEIRDSANQVVPVISLTPLEKKFHLVHCRDEQAERMAEIYRAVFPSYPFPVDDPEYLRETMESQVDYVGIEVDGELIALASAERDDENKNAEMTDFATLPEWRGHGLAAHLLQALEEKMRQRKIVTAYTIARAISPAMNITFAKGGYLYGGRLKNNTQISGQIESMNIWYKSLSDPSAG